MNFSPLYTSHKSITAHLTTPWKVIQNIKWSCEINVTNVGLGTPLPCLMSLLTWTAQHFLSPFWKSTSLSVRMLTLCRSLAPTLLAVRDSLPKTCRRGKPRSWPFLPERRAETERQRASWKMCQLGAVGAHGRSSRYSQKFSPVPWRLWWHRSMPDVWGAQRVGKGMLLSFALCDGLSQSPASELPPSLASCSTSSSPGPSLSLLFARSLLPSSLSLLKCGNFIPWREGGRWVSAFSFLPFQNSPLLKWYLLAPPFPFPSLPLAHTYTRAIHWPPSTPSASPRCIPHLSSPPPLLCRLACSLMSALIPFQFFIGNPFLFPDLLLQNISWTGQQPSGRIHREQWKTNR